MIIGLTGHIGVGKTEASKIFLKFGYKIIDADKIGHKILDKNIKKIGKIFGNNIIKNNKIDRKALGDIVFSNKSKLKKLNALIHPLIGKEILKLINNKKQNYVIEAAVLHLAKWDEFCDKVILIKSKKSIQIKRIRSIKKYSLNKIKSILWIQTINKVKESQVDYVIYNNKDKKYLYKQIISILNTLE